MVLLVVCGAGSEDPHGVAEVGLYGGLALIWSTDAPVLSNPRLHHLAARARNRLSA